MSTVVNSDVVVVVFDTIAVFLYSLSLLLTLVIAVVAVVFSGTDIGGRNSRHRYRRRKNGI